MKSSRNPLARLWYRLPEEERRFGASAAFLAALQGFVLLVVLGPDGFRRAVSVVIDALF